MTISRLQQQRDATILQLLSSMPTHAHDLERQLLAMGQWWCRKGKIHQHLKGLQAEGLVTSAWEIPAQGRPRLVYTITETGRAYMQRRGMPR
jgi:DNA-binding PadR family transcriptional regulator